MSAVLSDKPIIAQPNCSLADVTRRKLSDYAARRVRLELLKGVSLCVCASLVAITVAVVVDWIVIGEAARWLGAAAFYLLTIFCLYWFVLRKQIRESSLVSEAASIERDVPALKDSLQAAVELANTPGHDSIAFRERLQVKVAQQAAELDVPQLLPVSIINRPLSYAVFGICLFTLLNFIPALHLPNRVTRILAPGMDIGRVGHIQLDVLTPSPAEQNLAQGDLIAFAARASSLPTKPLVLQIRSNGETKTLTMQRQLSDSVESVSVEYSTVLGIDENELHYRICTDPTSRRWYQIRLSNNPDSSTPWYRITTTPRPRIEQYKKRIEAPEYAHRVLEDAGLPVTSTQDESSSHADVSAIIGSRVTLDFVSNIPLSGARLQWLGQGSTQPEREFVINDDEKTGHTEFQVGTSREFKVELEDKASGRNNPFSPTHRLQALADRPPTIRWLAPAQDLVVDIHALVPLEVGCADEFPLAELTERVAINGTEVHRGSRLPSIKKPLSVGQMTASWELDLRELNVADGDRINIVITARDCNGQRADTRTLTLLATAAKVDLQPSATEELRLEVAQQLEQLSLDVAAALDPRTQDGTSLDSAAQVQDILAGRTASLLESIERATLSSRDPASELESRQLADAVIALTTQTRNELGVLEEAKAPKIFSKIQANFYDLSNNVRALVGHDVVSRFASQLRVVAAAEDELARAINDGQVPMEQLQRRQDVLARQLKEIQTAMLDTAGQVTPGASSRLRQAASNMRWQIEQARQLASSDNAADMAQVASLLGSHFRQAALLNRLDNKLEATGKSARGMHLEATTASSLALHELASSIESRDSVDIVEDKLEIAVERAKVKRQLARVGEIADRKLAADFGDAIRAVESIMSSPATNAATQSEKIRQVANSVKTLNAGSMLNAAKSLMQPLIKEERWNKEEGNLFLEQPRLMNNFVQQLEAATQRLREAGVSRELIDELNRIRSLPSFDRARDEILRRQWDDRKAVSAAAELEQIQSRLEVVSSKIQQEMEAARNQLQQLTPSVSDLAEQAAKEIAQLEQKTRELNKDLADDSVPDTERRIQELRDQNNSTQSTREAVREALVDLADRQNVLDQKALETSKAADQAIELADRANQALEDSLENAESLPNGEAQQATAREAYEQIAQAFGEDKGMSASKQRETMQQLSQQFNIAEPDGNESNLDSEEYEQAEKLSRLAQASPEEVLRQLEQQLKQSQPMQESLSEISRTAAEQALAQLEKGGDMQQRINPQLESSDPQLAADKKLLFDDLKDLTKRVRHLLENQATGAQRAANQGGSLQQARQIRDTIAELQTAAKKADQVQQTTNNFKELQSVAKELTNAIESASDELKKEAEQMANRPDEEAIHSSDGAMRNRAREMQVTQIRVKQSDKKNSQQMERASRSRTAAADRALRDRERELSVLEKEAAKTMSRLYQSKGSERKAIQTQVDQLEPQVEMATAQVEAARALSEGYRERNKEIADEVRKANEKSPPTLPGKEPASELSEQLATEAATRLDEAASMLSQWSDRERPNAQAAQSGAEEAARAQRQVQQEVENAADGLERAARHEKRLEKEMLAERLGSAAGLTRSAADNEGDKASSSLEALKTEAANSPSGNQLASRENTAQAMQANANSLDAIQRATDAVRGVLGQQSSAQASQSQSAASPQDGSESGSDQLFSPQQMAEMLDELDRQLNSTQGSSEGQQQSGQQPSQQQGQSGSQPGQQPSSSLQSAAQQVASNLSQNRAPTPGQTPPNGKPGQEGQPPSQSTAQNAGTNGKADASPKPPSAVQLESINRTDGAWGELRQQSSDQLRETRRDTLSPQYRRMVEAYFRELSRKSQK